MSRCIRAAIVAAVILPALAPAETVTCVSKIGMTCSNQAKPCVKDRTAAYTFNIDRKNQRVTDEAGAVYKLLGNHSSPVSPEKAIVAMNNSIRSVVETIVIGEQSFVGSKVSVDSPNVYMQVGTCKGLQEP
jgi:hypothetical protein